MASSFSTLRQRGYGTFYAIRIEGIPYTFHEGPTPFRVDAEALPSPGTDYTSSESFMVIDNMKIDQELDRDSSIARGKALNIVLSWEILESEGILDLLFRRPAFFTTLTADLTATGAIISADTTGWPSAGQFYIGRELIKYTNKTSNNFIVGVGGSRGFLSYPYAFRKDDPGSHSIITPTPLAWKGRFVTVHEHLLTPEGRIMSSTLCSGDYQREIWKGSIYETPTPGKFGMALKTLPLSRLAAMPVGSEIHAEMIGMAESGYWSSLPIFVATGASVEMRFWLEGVGNFTVIAPIIQKSGATISDWPILPEGVHSIGTYMDAMADTVLAAFQAAGHDDLVGAWGTTGVGWDDTGPSNYPVNQKTEIPWAGLGMSIDMTVATGAENQPWAVYFQTPGSVYWMKPHLPYGDEYLFTGFYVETALDSFVSIFIRFGIDMQSTVWLSLKEVEGEGILDYALEETGYAVIEAGEHGGELVHWAEKVDVDGYGNSLSPRALLRLDQRMIGAEFSSVQQLPSNLNENGSFLVTTVVIDDLDSAARTLLESSGGGTRGDFDTLPLGRGMGIPEEWIDLQATGSPPATSADVPIVSPGKQSFEDLFSGWYQISNICLALRRSAAGVLQFQLVNVVPSMIISTSGAGYLGQSLGKSDVVVGGTSVPRLVVAPNQINVDTTAGPYESAQYAFNAIGRIQAEGVYSKSMAIPGGHSSIISAGVLSIMSRGLGQSIIKFSVAPWIDIEVGDPVNITVGHPMLFQWSDGTRAPENVPGRTLGWSKDLKTGEQTITILMDGILAPGFWLCPTTHIASISGNDVTVVRGEWFQSGETLRFYNRGRETTESADLAVTTVSGNVLTMASSPPAWFVSTASGPHPTKVTHPAYASGSTDQQNPFMYVRDDKFWRI